MEPVEPLSWIEGTIHERLREAGATVPICEWLPQTDADHQNDQTHRLKVRIGGEAIEIAFLSSDLEDIRTDPEFREEIRQRIATDIDQHLA